jgi:hypothetical protein
MVETIYYEAMMSSQGIHRSLPSCLGSVFAGDMEIVESWSSKGSCGGSWGQERDNQ